MYKSVTFGYTSVVEISWELELDKFCVPRMKKQSKKNSSSLDGKHLLTYHFDCNDNDDNESYSRKKLQASKYAYSASKDRSKKSFVQSK